MDTYSSSAALRRPSSQQSVMGSGTKLRNSINNIGSINGISKGLNKPRASSASINRKNNHRYESPAAGLGGNGFQPQIRNSGNYNNEITSTGAGAYSSTDNSRLESYEQIRRNYDSQRGFHNSGNMNTNTLYSPTNNTTTNTNNSISQRAQSASSAMRTLNTGAFSLNPGNNNAYLAMRQQTSNITENNTFTEQYGNNSLFPSSPHRPISATTLALSTVRTIAPADRQATVRTLTNTQATVRTLTNNQATTVRTLADRQATVRTMAGSSYLAYTSGGKKIYTLCAVICVF